MADRYDDLPPWELSGYEVGGEWHDIEAGDGGPAWYQWGEIERVTVNLDPESDEGMYRTYYLIGGFDDDYTIEDLIVEAMTSYGLMGE